MSTTTRATRLPKGKRITGPDRVNLAQDLAERYAGGTSVRDLARSIGRSYGFVHRVLGEAIAAGAVGPDGQPVIWRGQGAYKTSGVPALEQ